MLILTRKTGDTIRIDPDIELIVVGVRQGEVVLGLKAPRDLKILRGELTNGQPMVEAEMTSIHESAD